ncbi:MAG: 6-phosphofructokinase, partial [Telluria sp.]
MRIAILTGGGDAPGLNAVIRAVVLSAGRHGWECYGIRDGFNGILDSERYADGGV